MEACFLTAGGVQRTLARWINDYEAFHWAIAWGTKSMLSERLFDHLPKFKNVTFGVAFSQTDPDIVDALVGVANGFVATKFSGGTYHPKVYGFTKGKRAAVIVGSANFTRGGLGANLEAAIALTGTIEDPGIAEALAFAKKSASFGQNVTQNYADAYRASWKRAAGLPRAPREPVPSTLTTNGTTITNMDWADYAEQVRSSKHHDPKKSLELLAIARRWFAGTQSFAALSASQRKAIAGTIGEYQKLDADLNRDWGWFGSMRGAGDFANRIEKNDRFLARALDGIPRTGEVTRDHFEKYCEAFRRAFVNSSRTGGVPTATRLLAMKRPDTFLCVSSPNILEAAKALGFARTTLKLDNYWERVVEPIRLSRWHNADKPPNGEGELWEARAAMLDVLFYRP
ncbi:Restriction endonuclease type II NgoFVII N-terminal domain-containing protein [Nitratireductor aquimarinus]|uniref:phospholipase D family protein n=1 Tax=Nitratireductor aquimarinus TaxID=889300 RepID=UPI003B5B9313